MVKRKIDNRIRVMIENGVSSGHRNLFVVIGNRCKDQVVYLHHMLSKTSLKQASVLWCYKKTLAFSSHRRKRMKQLKSKQQYGNADPNEDDPLEMFVSMTDIRYCYYKETHKILGNTFKMCVIQDFEAITPNILCRAVETIEGGGLIILLLESVTSLKQFFTMNMDVHSRFRTESHQNVVPRFNERFLLSLASCPSCIVMNDELQILPISSLTRELESSSSAPGAAALSSKVDKELQAFKDKIKGIVPLGTLVSLCRTVDQAKAVVEFMEAISEKTLSSTFTLTAARGRGKSAAMGLALAGAVAVGYSNMFVTSPTPENLNTFFEFLIKGLDSLGYEKHLHFQILTSSNPDLNKAVVRIELNKDHRQIIQYISPTECNVLENAELLIIDEAAAIPLPHVQALLGPYLVFLSSTVSGYEGTGRSLSLKLMKELREETNTTSDNRGRKLLELSLKESIRYKDGDPVEKWLYDLLCLEVSVISPPKFLPDPSHCCLFYVNRDTLFGYHKISESFLKNVMTLLVSSHYRNCPDDLQTLSDAPAHHLFVLLPPSGDAGSLPFILCVVQVALEGKISKQLLKTSGGDKKPSGDLIPWTVSSLFQDEDFLQLSGARIVRIASHPDFQGRGYGTRAVELLEEYYSRSFTLGSTSSDASSQNSSLAKHIYEEEVDLLNETIKPKENPHPLLLSTTERNPESLDYMGVSFGASAPLLKFWKKAGFTCIYLSQVRNSLTGEHSCLLLKFLNEPKSSRQTSLLRPLWCDFVRRMLHLLPGPFLHLHSQFALSFITTKKYKWTKQAPSLSELGCYLVQEDLKKIDAFVRNQCDFPLISDVVPRVAELFFLGRMPMTKLTSLFTVILMGIGIQRKNTSVLAKELGLEDGILMSQVHSLLREMHTQLSDLWNQCQENEGSATECRRREDAVNIASQVASEISSEINQKRKTSADVREEIKQTDFSQFVIEGMEAEVGCTGPTPKRNPAFYGMKLKKLKIK